MRSIAAQLSCGNVRNLFAHTSDIGARKRVFIPFGSQPNRTCDFFHFSPFLAPPASISRGSRPLSAPERNEPVMEQKQILIIEDEEEIREGIRVLLGSEEYVFAEAENGVRGLALLNDQTDLVILDIIMPGMDGLSVCRQIRQRSSVPILFLSAKAQETDKLVGLMTGADDYLTKPFSYMELNARVKALLRRYHVYRGREENGAVSYENYIELDAVRISLLRNEVLLDGREINLTETEYQILLMLMKRPNRTHSAKTIYEQIWDEPFFYGANSTVIVHIKNLRRKIEANPQKPRRIVTVWGKGYLFRKQAAL